MCCHCLNRREFITLTSGAIATLGMVRAAGAVGSNNWPSDRWDPDRPFLHPGKALRVQPILMYSTPQRREKTSWKSWGGVQTEQAANEEVARITGELETLQKEMVCPLDIRPVIKTKSPEQIQNLDRSQFDVAVVYPATGSGNLLKACCAGNDSTLIFLRHRSGPVYYWYEGLSVRYLSTDKEREDDPALGDISVHDVVVDDTQELAAKLRGLYGVKNLLGTKIVALGGPWGKYAADAPQLAKENFGIEIIDVPYSDIEPRIQSLLADPSAVSKAERWTDRFLSLPGTELKTERNYVVNAFLLYGLMRDLMEENECSAFTIKDCMSTIMPMADTTACLTLGLLNDEGLLAFCESDFVIIPAGILLRHISGKPVFLHNSTFPHKAMVTCAHCASPRRFDGDRYEPTEIVTHYESEFGASPKVAMPIGQQLTFIDPEYTRGRWLGFRGTVEENPFYEICRSQQDVRIEGDWKKLLDEARDSHWMMAYGDHLAEVGYAARKLGVEWENITGEA
ncbi:MAG: sugar isomerase [Candidatus Omnitrophica bacterium]|nr:sugar isomerase [Candidatus Omnitrophota bacterium]